MSTAAAPPRHLQQEMFGRLLAAWRDWEIPNSPPRGRLSVLLDQFTLSSGRLLDELKGGKDTDLPGRGIWVVGPAVPRGTPSLFPVATASVWGDDASLSACLRVALIAHGDTDETPHVRVWGWRFDSAEQSMNGAPVPRPHAHAQPTSSWYINGARCLVHPHSSSDTGEVCPWNDDALTHTLNETHPAFPLRGETLPGLALAFVVSLYGAQTAREIIESEPTLKKRAGAVILEDFESVLGPSTS